MIRSFIENDKLIINNITDSSIGYGMTISFNDLNEESANILIDQLRRINEINTMSKM